MPLPLLRPLSPLPVTTDRQTRTHGDSQVSVSMVLRSRVLLGRTRSDEVFPVCRQIQLPVVGRSEFVAGRRHPTSRHMSRCGWPRAPTCHCDLHTNTQRHLRLVRHAAFPDNFRQITRHVCLPPKKRLQYKLRPRNHNLALTYTERRNMTVVILLPVWFLAMPIDSTCFYYCILSCVV